MEASSGPGVALVRVALLAGALVAAAFEVRPRSLGEAAAASPAVARALRPPPVERRGARGLRALPALGERRARDVVAARWAAGGDLPVERWARIDGIGPATLRALRGDER